MPLFPKPSKQTPPEISSLPNTPPSVYEEGEQRFAEIYGGAMVQSNRFFVVALASLVLAIAALGALVAVLPLKEIVPWIVEINPSVGVVNRPIEVQKVSPNTAVVKAELARWAEAVYTIDPLRTDDLFRFANIRARGKAVAQFSDFRIREQVFVRLQKEAGLVREAKVSSVDASQTGIAFIFIKTIERTGNQSAQDAKTRAFRLTLHYQVDPPKDEQALLANPLGIYINYFNEAEEKVQP